MNEIHPEQFDAMDELLDDARITSLRWSADSSLAEIDLDCCRADVATGKTLPDITLSFSGVSALGLSFEPYGVKPSEFSFPGAQQMLEHLATIEGGRDVYLARNHEEWCTDALSAPGLDWAQGDSGAFETATGRYVINIEQAIILETGCEVYVLIAAEGLHARDESGPVSLDDWSAQCAAWWGELKRQWAGKSDDVDDTYAAAIPGGEMKIKPGYRPPTDPVFALTDHDLPDDLLAATKDWFEREHSARPDEYPEWQWPYARRVESWWIDGARARVNMLGINHRSPSDRGPSTNTVWTFHVGLRLRSASWVVAECSWGNAELDERADGKWMSAWNGGRIGPPSWLARVRYKLYRTFSR